MRTIGPRLPKSRIGDATAFCDYCGVLWYLSQLRVDRAGLLVCKDDEGADRVTCDEENARAIARAFERQRQEDRTDYMDPAGVQMPIHPGYALELQLEGSSGVTTDSDGRLVSIVDSVGGRTFEPYLSGTQGPLWSGQNINGRQAIGLFDLNSILETSGIPMEGKSMTIFMVVDPPAAGAVSPRSALVRMRNSTTFELCYFFWDQSGTHRITSNPGISGGGGTTETNGGVPVAGPKVLVIDFASGSSGVTYGGTKTVLAQPAASGRVPRANQIQYGGVQDPSVPFNGGVFGGVIGEVLHFSPFIRDAGIRERMVDYLERRWSII